VVVGQFFTGLRGSLIELRGCVVSGGVGGEGKCCQAAKCNLSFDRVFATAFRKRLQGFVRLIMSCWGLICVLIKHVPC